MWGSGGKKRTTNIDTLIHQNSEIIGDVRFSGGLHIAGTIKGNVLAENDGHSMVQLSDVYYNLIEMAVGAEVNGKLVHTQVSEKSSVALQHINPLEAE